MLCVGGVYEKFFDFDKKICTGTVPCVCVCVRVAACMRNLSNFYQNFSTGTVRRVYVCCGVYEKLAIFIKKLCQCISFCMDLDRPLKVILILKKKTFDVSFFKRDSATADILII